GAARLELGDVRGGGRHGLALRHQEVAAVARAHGDLVAQAAEVRHFLKKNEFHGSALRVVVVGVRDQRQVAGALHRGGQLALVLGLGAGDPARHDLAGLGQVLAQGVEILVVDLLDALGRELAVLAAAEELGHVCGLLVAQAASAVLASDLSSPSLPSLPSLLSSSRRRRSPRSGLSPFSSLFFMISDGSVTASSRRITRWRRIASLKRNASTSSFSTSWPASMLNST